MIKAYEKLNPLRKSISKWWRVRAKKEQNLFVCQVNLTIIINTHFRFECKLISFDLIWSDLVVFVGSMSPNGTFSLDKCSSNDYYYYANISKFWIEYRNVNDIILIPHFWHAHWTKINRKFLLRKMAKIKLICIEKS